MENTMRLFGKTVYGARVSDYGLKNGYMDYKCLATLVGDCILNNNLINLEDIGEWESVVGQQYYGVTEDGCCCDMDSEDCVGVINYDVYQYYIISYEGYRFLNRYTDEIVYYNEELDLYLWGITHFGTSWDYVLTNIKLVGDEE